MYWYGNLYYSYRLDIYNEAKVYQLQYCFMNIEALFFFFITLGDGFAIKILIHLYKSIVLTLNNKFFMNDILRCVSDWILGLSHFGTLVPFITTYTCTARRFNHTNISTIQTYICLVGLHTEDGNAECKRWPILSQFPMRCDQIEIYGHHFL